MKMPELNKSQPELTETLADAIWQRIRFLARSWMQYESFVPVGSNFMPVGKNVPETESSVPGASDYEQIALDFVLLTLREALESENFRIISELAREGGQTAAQLAASLGMNDLTLQERLSGLMQSGFVTRDYERGSYLNSPAGSELAASIREIQTGVTRRLQAELPSILGSEKKGE